MQESFILHKVDKFGKRIIIILIEEKIFSSTLSTAEYLPGVKRHSFTARNQIYSGQTIQNTVKTRHFESLAELEMDHQLWLDGCSFCESYQDFPVVPLFVQKAFPITILFGNLPTPELLSKSKVMPV